MKNVCGEPIHGDPSMEADPKEPMHEGQSRGTDPWWSIEALDLQADPRRPI